LRETRRTNRDGSVVSYLQLAHNERHPVTGSPVAKVIHNFGRADKVDREALRRLVASISRFLEPGEAVAATEGTEVEIVDARRFGGAYVLDQLWHRLGIAQALQAAAGGRRVDAEAVERILFALVAQRCLEPFLSGPWGLEREVVMSAPARVIVPTASPGPGGHPPGPRCPDPPLPLPPPPPVPRTRASGCEEGPAITYRRARVVAQSRTSRYWPYPPSAAIHPNGHLRVVGLGEQFDGLVRLGREHHIVRHAGFAAAVRVGGPAFRQVQPVPDERVPTTVPITGLGQPGVGQHHDDLAVLDLVGRPARLGRHPNRLGPFLMIWVSSILPTAGACIPALTCGDT
jgi:hypothetical protein